MLLPIRPRRAIAAALGALAPVASFAAPLAAQTSDSARIAAVADSVAAATLAGGRVAGLSIAVSLGGRPILARGYGMADLEWQVPTAERTVYEIGSVTKQFTAAAIMRLVEAGKVDLDADVTTYVPEFDAQGRRVTVRRLLDHTSGIKPYTMLPAFQEFGMRTLPRDTIVTLLSKTPFVFEPGAVEAYNNSGFFLAGLIVERTSGVSYAEYVRTQLFERAGMRDSRYCDVTTVVPRRARGYQLGGQGLERAHYLDHTWPFAAGSLCSTVADLDAWNRALHGGKILGAGAYREMIAPGTLADGTTLGYAKGLGVGELAGHPAIHHGGAISGFLSYVAWFPERELSIAVSVNTMGPVQPLDVVRALARSVLGEPAARVARLEGKAADYVGEYRGVGGLGEEMVMRVSADSSGALLLESPFSGPTPRPLTPLGGGTFRLDDNRVRFVREDGRITGLSFDATYALLVLRRD